MPSFRFAQECDNDNADVLPSAPLPVFSGADTMPRPMHRRAPRNYRGIFDGATCAQLADAAESGAALEEVFSRAAPDPARTQPRSIVPALIFAALAYTIFR